MREYIRASGIVEEHVMGLPLSLNLMDKVSQWM